MSTLFDTEKYFLVYWEEEDSVSMAKSSDVKDPPPEKVMIGDIVSIKCHGKLCKGKVAEIGESKWYTCKLLYMYFSTRPLYM